MYLFNLIKIISLICSDKFNVQRLLEILESNKDLILIRLIFIKQSLGLSFFQAMNTVFMPTIYMYQELWSQNYHNYFMTNLLYCLLSFYMLDDGTEHTVYFISSSYSVTINIHIYKYNFMRNSCTYWVIFAPYYFRPSTLASGFVLSC